ncbi:hypothetical protein ACFY7C_36790 [Streptomyces sp. NPDC012769]|uniref:hypothetical protein n=1 Tax=Streptomyces sp. NPDC012769 TaxID=3364848 RepID=UPI0036C38098
MTEVDKSLRKAKFGIGSSPVNVDEFGQVYNSDSDPSKWSAEDPADSRKAHARSDVDLSPRSLHHTLGNRRNQASPGDHNHDGTTSKKIGPLEMDPANNGKTRAVWTIPVAPTITDVVNLIKRFVEVRSV